MAKKRGGRPRKPGERYRSGDLRPTGEPVAPATWDRIKKDAIARAIDPRAGSEVGRLAMNRELSSTQVVAAFKVAEIYGAFERLEGIKRSARSASYESGLRGIGGIDENRLTTEEREKLINRQAAIKEAFLALSEEIKIYPRSLRETLEMLCVEDRPINPMQLGNMRVMLDRLAGFFGKTKRTPPAHRGAARARAFASTPRAKPRVDLDRQAFITVARAMRPDLSDDELSQAHEFTRAIKARAIVRRSKEARAGR